MQNSGVADAKMAALTVLEDVHFHPGLGFIKRENYYCGTPIEKKCCEQRCELALSRRYRITKQGNNHTNNQSIVCKDLKNKFNMSTNKL